MAAGKSAGTAVFRVLLVYERRQSEWPASFVLGNCTPYINSIDQYMTVTAACYATEEVKPAPILKPRESLILFWVNYIRF